MLGRIRFTMVSTALMIVLAWAAPFAQAEARMRFDLPTQPLADSLRAVGSQSNINILFDPPLIAGRLAPSLSEELTTNEALSRLLAGTGITHEFLNETTVVLATAPAAVPSKGKEVPAATSTTSTSSSKDGVKAEGDQKKSFWDRFRVAQADPGKTAGNGTVEKSGTSPDTEEAVKLEEIVVTAQKRQERLKDVPISISVLSGEQLDSFNGASVNDALTTTPGVVFTQSQISGSGQLSVRGVISGGFGLQAGSSPVAYYVDTVPFGFVKTAFAPDVGTFDLERVEVLRGPQGTLHGANALNGVVRVLTKDADLEKSELKLRTSLSSTEQGAESFRGDVAFNVPLIEGKLAARAVLGYGELGGWIDTLNQRDANKSVLKNGRLKLNAQPSDKLSLGLSYWHSETDTDGIPFGDVNDKYLGVLKSPSSLSFDTVGLRVSYDFPGFTVASMSSYIDYTNDSVVDLTPFGFFGQTLMFNKLDSKVTSEELIFSSDNEGLWRWTAGAFYRDADDDFFQESVFFSNPALTFGDISESYALFGELTRKFMEGRLELTAGARYFEDHYVGPTKPSIRATAKFEDVSPRLVLTWHPHSDMTAYASYSEGFRSGFNQTELILEVAPQFAPAKEDTLRNYEVGAKGDLVDGLFTYEAAVYYMDWQDVQQLLVYEIRPGFSTNVQVNAGSASGLGTDLALNAHFRGGLELGVNLSWNDLAFDTNVASGGPNSFLFKKGDRPSRSPELTAGASAGYAFPLSSELEGRLTASANYTSRQSTRSIFGNVIDEQPGDTLMNAHMSFSVTSHDHWTAELFVDNATNDRGYPTYDRTFPFYNPRLRPRTIGLQFEYRY